MDWEIYRIKMQTQGVKYLLDELAPYHKISKQEYKLRLPLINHEILDEIKERDKFLKIFH